MYVTHAGVFQVFCADCVFVSVCLCVGEGWGGVVGGGCCKGEGDGAGSSQVVRYGRNQQVGGTVAHDLIHPEAGRTDGGEREGGWRSSGLEKVGVAGCHGHTNTQTQRKEVGNRLD